MESDKELFEAQSDFASYIAYLEQLNLLIRINEELDTDHDIGDYMYKSASENGPALLFEKAISREPKVRYAMPLVGALICSRQRASIAVGSKEEDALNKCIYAQEHPVSPVTVSDPYKRRVIQGNDIDLLQLFPVVKCSPHDGGKYISTGVVFVKDPQYGRNVAISRHQVLGKKRLGILAVPPQHTGIYLNRAKDRGEKLQVCIALSCAPDLIIASQFKPAIGVDESTIAGGLRQRPVEFATCQSIENEFPVSAHVVIEGEIPLDVTESEGPFGEYTGYYGERRENQPVIDVKAVTIREDIQPIFYGSCPMPIENDVIKELPIEANTLFSLERSCPGVKNVRCPTYGGCEDFVIIQLCKTFEDEGKIATLAAFGTGARPKIVIAVDDDVNLFDEQEVLNALTYRMQPGDDVSIVRIGGKLLDPSFTLKSPDGAFGIGIDATKPLKTRYFERLESHKTSNEIPGTSR